MFLFLVATLIASAPVAVTEAPVPCPGTCAAALGAENASPDDSVDEVLDGAEQTELLAPEELPEPDELETEKVVKNSDLEAEDEEAEDDEEAQGDDGEAESRDVLAEDLSQNGHRYTSDISDEELERLWTETPAALGSMSVGFADSGRLINAEACRPGDNWTIVSAFHCWGTKETLESIYTAIDEVALAHPDTLPLRVNHISSKDGGWLRPHASHQSGRDVDLAFYYKDGQLHGSGRRRENQIDLDRNWTLIKALVTKTDLQVVLVDQRIVDVLYKHALEQGEDKAWLDRIFRSGKASLVRHARRHHDHFHVRFYNPRAQELGRRIVPLLARQPEHNFAMHRVKRGDTLGAIARRYGSSVKNIQKANGMKNTFLKLGRVLKVPMRKPCTQCPLPPELIVPERLLPSSSVASTGAPELPDARPDES